MNNITLAENTLGQRIKAQRMKMGYTQEKFAELMCIPKKTISGYENDRVDIRSSVISELAEHLHTTPNYLLGYEEDPALAAITNALNDITDEKVKAMLLVQIHALANACI